MKWFTLLATATLLGTPVCAQTGKPDVLFLFADDMRADSIAALGNPIVQTPAIDSLVNRGVALTNAYCMGGNSAAVCLPSRNMMLSGQAYFRWKDHPAASAPRGQRGLYAPASPSSFPRVMRDAGYLTYHHGKRGNTAPAIQAQFEINKYLKNDDAERRSGEPGKEIVDDALTFLKSRTDSRPVFMYLAFGNPHDPRVAASKYRDRYDAAKMPVPKNFAAVHPFDNGELIVRDEQLLPWPRTEADVRRTQLEYYATVTALDHHIGRLLAYLAESGKLDNTLIVFSADQGIAVGSHGLLGKQNLYDHSMKAPLIFAGPGITKGRSEALAYLFDVLPTVCDLVGAKKPASIDGQSLRPVLAGQGSGRTEIMLAYRNVQRAIRDTRWKLIRYPAIDRTQLFDLQADPDEINDLAADPSQRERIRDLVARLERQQKHFGDDLPLTAAGARPSDPITPESLRQRTRPAKKP